MASMNMCVLLNKSGQQRSATGALNFTFGIQITCSALMEAEAEC